MKFYLLFMLKYLLPELQLLSIGLDVFGNRFEIAEAGGGSTLSHHQHPIHGNVSQCGL